MKLKPQLKSVQHDSILCESGRQRDKKQRNRRQIHIYPHYTHACIAKRCSRANKCSKFINKTCKIFVRVFFFVLLLHFLFFSFAIFPIAADILEVAQKVAATAAAIMKNREKLSNERVTATKTQTTLRAMLALEALALALDRDLLHRYNNCWRCFEFLFNAHTKHTVSICQR